MSCEEKRTNVIIVRVSDNEKRLLKKKADKEGTKVSQLVRDAAIPDEEET